MVGQYAKRKHKSGFYEPGRLGGSCYGNGKGNWNQQEERGNETERVMVDRSKGRKSSCCGLEKDGTHSSVNAKCEN